jgi:hypothetical protein
MRISVPSAMSPATNALAGEALNKLREVNVQLRTVVILANGVNQIAGADLRPRETAGEASVRALADAAPRFWSTLADLADERVAQAEIATTVGSVFLVGEDGDLIAATTGPDPAAGLAFYDLRAALRWITAREGDS